MYALFKIQRKENNIKDNDYERQIGGNIAAKMLLTLYMCTTGIDWPWVYYYQSSMRNKYIHIQ